MPSIRDLLAEVKEGLNVHMRSQADAHMEALGLACLLINDLHLDFSISSSATVLKNALGSTESGNAVIADWQAVNHMLQL